MAGFLSAWPCILQVLFLMCIADANFTVNHDKHTFYMDGKPFRYVSGSVHYFRMPNEYWRDRLRKVRAGGLNAVSTYVEWSQHEPQPDVYNFGGDLDLIKFIKIAQEEGLYVILRPGPYICAERDFGGFPYWLLAKHPKMKLRTKDSKYTKYVEKWLNVLLPKITPYLHGNGGPIIMVQVENEYGFYHACDHKYNIWLRDIFRHHISDKAVLFTTDSPKKEYLKCGKIPGVYATVDFGPEVNVDGAFAVQRKFEPRGPLVNSEYYPGWLTHWGEKMAHKETSDVVRTLKKMLSVGANVNFYMYFGGTNFGFTAGANFFETYQSDITSYDYDAPINEAGDPTEKYYAIRNAIAEYMPVDRNMTFKAAEKAHYGEHKLKAVATLFSPCVRSSMGAFNRSMYPHPFEVLNRNTGYVLYETDLRKSFNSPMEYVLEYNDHVNVYVDGNFIKSMSREKQQNKFILDRSCPGQKLGLVVENLGRINFGEKINELKGLTSNITRRGKTLDRWNMTSFELKTMKPIENCFREPSRNCHSGQGYVFYVANFTLPANATRNRNKYLLDSFLDVTSLKKGVVFINDINLGRYWSSRGPQFTLYVPGVYLKPNPHENMLVIMDEYINEDEITVTFTKNPILVYE